MELNQIHSIVYLELIVSRPQDTIETHERAGLNWGQRDGRDRNEAYIPIPAPIYDSGFFPEVGQYFEVLTDNGETLTLVRAQERGKALHTPEDNSILGIYFRKRLNVPFGQAVTFKDLTDYGRTFVTIAKTKNGIFLMDFDKIPKLPSPLPFQLPTEHSFGSCGLLLKFHKH